MNNKILVTYASRFGSTAGVAEAIGKTLAENGMNVDVLPMREVKNLSPISGCGRWQCHQRGGMASRSHAIHAIPSGGIKTKTLRRVFGVHDPDHA
jgi:hypothetical protein